MVLYYSKSNGVICLGTDETEDCRYIGYSLREAEQAYREKHDLVGKHLHRVRVSAAHFGYPF